jgi:hypothetical protein
LAIRLKTPMTTSAKAITANAPVTAKSNWGLDAFSGRICAAGSDHAENRQLHFKRVLPLK